MSGSDGTEGPSARGEESGQSQRGAFAPAVLTFLIADVRGYTRFTQEHGDEEAGRLATAFAELARETIIASGGELIELRGDEALCVFGSARQALRAAVELQINLRRQTDEGPAFPLPIGVGLDAGEAVPIEGGYRGGALNTAARLCSLAGPGQILATDTVVSLARRLEGIRFVDRRPVRLKGLDKAVRVIEVVPEAGLPPLPEIAKSRRRRVTPRMGAAAAIAGVALVAGGIALVVSRALGPDYLSRLDPNAIGVIGANAAGIKEQVRLGSRPTAMAAGGGYVWVASEDDGTVSRIDPVTRAVQRVTVGESAAGVAYGGGSVWVALPNERGLAQIDPATLRVVQTIPVGNGPGGVAAGARAVWVANTSDGTISRIDLRRGAVTKTIPVGLRPTGIAVGARALWVTDELNGIVLRIDPRSRRVVSGISVGNGPTSVAVSEGRAWVANRQDGTVSRIDTSTNSVSAATPVGAGPSSVATGSGKVWVASEGDGTIARLEARTGRVDKMLSLDSSPHALAVSRGNLWVAALPSLGSHRGGVLRVESVTSTCRCTDPGFQTEAFSFTDQSVFTLAYDGLVAYRRVGGIAGGALVGDLAIDVPAPTDHGRTYTFQLRKDLRYANGAPVRASDVRYSLERVLTVNRTFALGYYKGIVGATRCAARPPKRCDLSRGIDVDDRARSITIHLTEADSDFVHKLTFPLAFVVPTGTPLRLGRERNTPGTGPYRVASFAPDRAVRLVRNPYFRVWSQDARPDGYPDEIRFHLGEDYAASLTAVEKGTADWTQVVASALPAGSVQGLLTRDAGRLHSDPLPVTFWTFMNTRVPPFDDVRVRRALNYAIDRTVLEQIGGGVLRAPAACQILPPGFPGYRPYCPYTLHPNPAGTWTAPDLAKARALVSASGTRGMRVEAVIFHSTTGGVERSFQYVVSVLRRLGYRSSLRVLPTRGPGAFTAYGDYVADSRNRVQIGFSGWLAGTLAASDFLRLFSCAAFRRESTANENTSEFCARGIDAQMRRAAALQTSDPARANELWAGVDRALVDRVAVAPTLGGRNLVLVSERAGNYQNHPLWGTLLDQLWVK